MGTHLKVLRKSYPMNTNMTGFRRFSIIFASLCFRRIVVFWTKVASALEGLIYGHNCALEAFYTNPYSITNYILSKKGKHL